jgi:hypothetical protein
MKYILPILLCFIAACGSERTEEQQTVEQETVEAGPMLVETPFGNFVVHQTGYVRKRSQFRTTKDVQNYTFPEVKEWGGAMLSGLTGPLAGGGVVGLIASLGYMFIRRKNEAEKLELTNQRNELIAGAERSKSDLSTVKIDEDTTAWDILKKHLEAEQSKKTKDAVREQTV